MRLESVFQPITGSDRINMLRPNRCRFFVTAKFAHLIVLFLKLILPACIWFYDYGDYRKQGLLKKVYFAFNCFIFLLGSFVTTAGSR